MPPVIGTPGLAEGFGSAQSVAVDAGSGSNRVLYGFLLRNNRDLNGIPTYNGVNGTLVGDAVNGAKHANLYRWIAPATGSHALDFTTLGDTDWKLIGVPVSDVDQTTPNDIAETLTGSGSPQSDDIASGAVKIVLAAGWVSWVGGGASLTLGGSTTSIDVDLSINAGGAHGTWCHYEDGAASVTMSASGGQWGSWAHIAISINGVAAAAGVLPKPQFSRQAVQRASSW